MADGGEKLYSQKELDQRVAEAEVKTMLMILIDDFRDHKKDDDKHFDGIYEVVRNLPKDMEKKFVSRREVIAGFAGLGLLQTLIAILIKFT